MKLTKVEIKQEKMRKAVSKITDLAYGNTEKNVEEFYKLLTVIEDYTEEAILSETKNT